MPLPLVPLAKIAPACRCLLLRETLCSPSIPTPAHLHIRGEQIREFRTARVNRFRTEMAHLRAFDFLLLSSVKVMRCFGSWISSRFHVIYKNFDIRYFWSTAYSSSLSPVRDCKHYTTDPELCTQLVTYASPYFNSSFDIQTKLNVMSSNTCQ
jgi:hypothetical protein